jgi:hypothetical protein
LEANFAPSVRGRVELFQTRYRRAADRFGEAWLVLDGKRRFSWGDATFIQAESAAYAAPYYARMPILESNQTVLADLEARGATMRWQLNVILLDALNLSIDLMLKHRSPVVRGLAVLDRRFGKRRLLVLNPATEHPFVRSMFEFRCDAEGIRALTAGSTATARKRTAR